MPHLLNWHPAFFSQNITFGHHISNSWLVLCFYKLAQRQFRTPWKYQKHWQLISCPSVCQDCRDVPAGPTADTVVTERTANTRRRPNHSESVQDCGSGTTSHPYRCGGSPGQVAGWGGVSLWPVPGNVCSEKQERWAGRTNLGHG